MRKLISVILILCILFVTSPAVFAEDGGTESYSEKIIFSVSDYANPSEALNRMANSYNHNGGYFDSNVWQYVWRTDAEIAYKAGAYSIVWDQMDKYGLSDYTAELTEEEASNAANITSPTLGYYDLNAPTNTTRAMRTVKRNLIELWPQLANPDLEVRNYSYINFVLYSSKITNDILNVRLGNYNSSENRIIKFNNYGAFNIDWENEWKVISIPVSDFLPSSGKYGLEEGKDAAVNYFTLSVSNPSADSVLYIDSVFMSTGIPQNNTDYGEYFEFANFSDADTIHSWANSYNHNGGQYYPENDPENPFKKFVQNDEGSWYASDEDFVVTDPVANNRDIALGTCQYYIWHADPEETYDGADYSLLWDNVNSYDNYYLNTEYYTPQNNQRSIKRTNLRSKSRDIILNPDNYDYMIIKAKANGSAALRVSLFNNASTEYYRADNIEIKAGEWQDILVAYTSYSGRSGEIDHIRLTLSGAADDFAMNIHSIGFMRCPDNGSKIFADFTNGSEKFVNVTGTGFVADAYAETDSTKFDYNTLKWVTPALSGSSIQTTRLYRNDGSAVNDWSDYNYLNMWVYNDTEIDGYDSSDKKFVLVLGTNTKRQERTSSYTVWTDSSGKQVYKSHSDGKFYSDTALTSEIADASEEMFTPYMRNADYRLGTGTSLLNTNWSGWKLLSFRLRTTAGSKDSLTLSPTYFYSETDTSNTSSSAQAPEGGWYSDVSTIQLQNGSYNTTTAVNGIYSVPERNLYFGNIFLSSYKPNRIYADNINTERSNAYIDLSGIYTKQENISISLFEGGTAIENPVYAAAYFDEGLMGRFYLNKSLKYDTEYTFTVTDSSDGTVVFTTGFTTDPGAGAIYRTPEYNSEAMKATVINDTNDPISCVLITAVYDTAENTLISVDYLSAKIDAYKTQEIKQPVKLAAGQKVKSFIWNNKEEMLPLSGISEASIPEAE